ncbi:MAG: MBL fold metallo-hydrolase [Synergistales bacterium]|nr:MBL fold metallo-hydrolase [Synergistales bacterium]
MQDYGRLEGLRVTIVAEDSVRYESPYWGQHGISFLLEARTAEGEHRVLVDVAQDYTALRHNMDLLDIDPSTLDAVVLTHCHYDHTRGLARLLEDAGTADLPVIAHPDLFRPHLVTAPCIRHVGVTASDSRERLEERGARMVLVRDPLPLMPGLVTTGEVPRTTSYESAGIALMTVEDGTLRRDQVLDDISLAASVRDEGVVVVTGCSHAGIVNITRQSLALYPGEPLVGITGGFHLIEADAEKIERTVEGLAELGPQWIRAGHCTGFEAQMALRGTFGEAFTPLRTGDVFSVGW